MPDHNQKLRDAIFSTGLECSEEPMRKDLVNQPYAVWRKVFERTVFSSGQPLIRYTRFTIEAYLPPGEGAQAKAEGLIAALRSHGFVSVREANRSYDALVNRRILTIYASLRENL